MGPSLAGYLEFIRLRMQIGTADLPDDSPWIPGTYEGAVMLVNRDLEGLPGAEGYSTIYAQAIYNLAGDYLLNWTPDQANASVVPGSDPPLKYFEYQRKHYNLLGFTSGVVQSTGNDASNVSLVVPEQMQSLTVADLQSLKTPWGRAYIGIAQQDGPTIWGLS